MLIVGKVSAGRAQLQDPESAVWGSVPASSLALAGTPLGTQPTPYTRAAWKGRKIGAVSDVEMRLCHDGESLFVRLAWADPSENRALEENNTFPDGAAVLFPIGGDAPINTMGNDREGVNGWQWRADSAQGRSVVAHGLGTTEPNTETVHASAVRKAGGWQVVLSRALVVPGSGETSVALEPGATSRIGAAIWEGSNGERAGFKAFTEEWTDIQLEDAS